MGLGRHRSTRHGVVSQRAQRRQSAGGWLSRQDAAKRAGVHYNTIRQWEEAGLLRTTTRPHLRGSLVSTADLSRLLAERATAGAGPTLTAADGDALQELASRYDILIRELERVLAAARLQAPDVGSRRRRKK